MIDLFRGSYFRTLWLASNLALLVKSGLYSWDDIVNHVETTVTPFRTTFVPPTSTHVPSTTTIPTASTVSTSHSAHSVTPPDTVARMVSDGQSYVGVLMLLIAVLVFLVCLGTMLCVVLYR